MQSWIACNAGHLIDHTPGDRDQSEVPQYCKVIKPFAFSLFWGNRCGGRYQGNAILTTLGTPIQHKFEGIYLLPALGTPTRQKLRSHFSRLVASGVYKAVGAHPIEPTTTECIFTCREFHPHLNPSCTRGLHPKFSPFGSSHYYSCLKS